MLNSTVVYLATFLTLLTNIISLISHQTIKSKIFGAYSKLTASGKYKELQLLKHKQVQINRERNSISAQDNYAKWVKLNRQFDKLASQITELERNLSAQKFKVDGISDLALKIITILPINGLKLWYSRKELIFLPNGLFPWYVESFVLNFPWLSRGSVGLIVWLYCVDKIFWILVDAFKLAFLEEKLTKPVHPSEKVSEVKVEPKKTK
ncbi:unnamed protein product [Ambrosiozyma monospora]|uniref:Unnamed protein product n=1 Tax=Ambrosiozyma monospora TaxID=43982 RepID=A0ACB5U3K8_AMBMO|nr:unnamed protein product [Ambrosiozyma monospora]